MIETCDVENILVLEEINSYEKLTYINIMIYKNIPL